MVSIQTEFLLHMQRFHSKKAITKISYIKLVVDWNTFMLVCKQRYFMSTRYENQFDALFLRKVNPTKRSQKFEFRTF